MVSNTSAVPANERVIITNALEYWFTKDWDRHTSAPSKELFQKWFFGGSPVDQEIAEQFQPHMEKFFAGDYEAWKHDKDGALALVIFCDQWTRNVYRKSPKAFAYDTKAIEIAESIIADEGRFS